MNTALLSKFKFAEVWANSRKILNLALPLIIALSAQKCLYSISALMMGLLGTDALAAGALATSSAMTLIVVCIGVISAIGILIAQASGANSKEGITRYIYSGVWVALLLSIPVMLIMWYLPAFLLAIGQQPNLVILAKEYMHAVMWGLPALLGFFILREFVAALNQPRLLTYISVAAIPFNAALSYTLMYGKFGLPASAIAGIGYANALTEWAMFFALLSCAILNKSLQPYLLKPETQWFDWRAIAQIFRIGLPSGITFFFDVGMCALFTLMMGYIGANSLAAHQIAMQCTSFVYMVPMGLGIATGLLVSKQLATKNIVAAKHILHSALGLSFIFAIIVAIVFFITPITLINFFIHPNETHYDQVKTIAISFLGIAAFFHCFDAMQAIMLGGLRGFKDTVAPMIITLFSYFVVGIGSAYLFAFKLKLGGVGIWWGFAFGFAFAGIMLWLRFIFLTNSKEVRVNHKSNLLIKVQAK